MKKLLFFVIALGLSTGFAKSEKKESRKPNQANTSWAIKSINLEDNLSLMGLMYDQGERITDRDSASNRLYYMKIVCDGGTKSDGYESNCWIEKNK